MKRIMLWAGVPVIVTILVSMASCGGRSVRDGGAGAGDNDTIDNDTVSVSFTTDSVECEDSLSVGGCKATMSVSGLYPAEDGSAADSVRAWVARHLSFAAGSTDTPLFNPTAADIADGRKLASATVAALMDMSRTNFEEFERDSITMSYEFESHFSPVFVSDSLLTYSYSGYVYLGGAHGGAIGVGQTFNRNNGEALTFANTIQPTALDALKGMIRRALWTQYFKPDAASDGINSLREALLIDPDTLPLPASAPEFMADGLHIIYQQYEIACYAAGMPAVVLSYDSVAPLIRPSVRPLLPQ